MPLPQLRVMKLTQNGKELYLGLLSGRQIRALNIEVDAWNVFTGYQRVKLTRKANRIASFLESNRGLMPTSILVAVRSDMVRYDPIDDTSGNLSFPQRALVHVVDGQHRVEGLRIAAGRTNRLQDFAFPVVFMCPVRWPGDYDSSLEEGKQFITINKTQSKVPLELVDSVIRRIEFVRVRDPARAHESLPNDIYDEMEIRSRALDIVNWLNGRTVWRGLIRLANAPRAQTTVNQSVMVDTIVKELLQSPPYDAMRDQEIQRRLLNYWRAIRDRYPRADANPQQYFVQRRLGVSVLHRIFPKVDSVVNDPRERGEYQTALRAFHIEDQEYWGPNGRASEIGESYKTVRKEAAKMGRRRRPRR